MIWNAYRGLLFHSLLPFLWRVTTHLPPPRSGSLCNTRWVKRSLSFLCECGKARDSTEQLARQVGVQFVRIRPLPGTDHRRRAGYSRLLFQLSSPTECWWDWPCLDSKWPVPQSRTSWASQRVHVTLRRFLKRGCRRYAFALRIPTKKLRRLARTLDAESTLALPCPFRRCSLQHRPGFDNLPASDD
jgi:hypothetical protein